MPRPEPKGHHSPIDSGKRKAVRLAVVKYGKTAGGVEFAECSCGKPFTHARRKVREDQIDKHIKTKHGGRGVRL